MRINPYVYPGLPYLSPVKQKRRSPRKWPELDKLFDVCCNSYDLYPDYVVRNRTRDKVCCAKNAYCYFARKYYSYIPVADVAAVAGYKNHASVFHGEIVAKDFIDIKDALFIDGFRKIQEKVLSII